MKSQALLKEAFNWCEEVCGHDSGRACLFSNILDMIPAECQSEGLSYTQKLHAINMCTLAERQHCLQHSVRPGGMACCPHKPVHFDVSGLPCPDMSTANQNRKMRAGPTNSVFLTHGRWCTRNRIPLLLVECTPDTFLTYS